MCVCVCVFMCLCLSASVSACQYVLVLCRMHHRSAWELSNFEVTSFLAKFVTLTYYRYSFSALNPMRFSIALFLKNGSNISLVMMIWSGQYNFSRL